MFKNIFKYIPFLLLLFFMSCAKRGAITGGLKDTIAPTLKYSLPENYSVKFQGNKIKLVFDENIKLKNLNKQLIISPPMKNEPLIIPTTPTKTLTITINDTLQPNTTYSLNFGQSIADNNEGNPYNLFKYVFSTGDYIDSLTLGGRVKDAYDKEVASFVSIMLYEANEKFNDSTIYKENPRYITNTLDSLKTFRLENLKAGKYFLVAMKDNNSNNKFNPKSDRIGFTKQIVTIPNDTVFELELFKEELPFKAIKPAQASGNRLIVGYEGSPKINGEKAKFTLKNNGQIIPSIITKIDKKDSLQVWFKPLKVDSLSLNIVKDKYQKDFTFKVKNQKSDTLSIKAIQSGVLNFRDRFTLESSTPLVNFDKSKMKLTDKDSAAVAFTTAYDEYTQQLFIDFKIEEAQKYNFKLMPGAVTDFLEKTNDTLSFSTSTRNRADYGNLIVSLKNVKRFPLIIELANEKGDIVKASEYTEGKTEIEFNLLEPSVYTLRAIYDDNKNKEWDTGNYLEKRQAEEVVYFSKGVDIRTNWDVNQPFDLSIPYTPEPKKKKEKEKKKSSSF
ncbi:Ig-like domain-containing protein [Flavobacterium taihuense]|uniref:Ig-like domain-containing protein n=1 Tax=Flavobacterium taihuense TaxID=2857508 RepID=A0ABS6XRY2_9FLAO|nr:Ig-like domain-containing protein [Flavobacterium taihuense]MBW4359122.1 Ig-like domain-containing protein [Flavobacterium taihuense]